MGDFWDDLRKRMYESLGVDGPEGLAGLATLARPQPPFDGRGSALVAFGSMLLVIASFAAAIFSLAGLVVSLAAIYLVCAKVFGLKVDLRDDLAF